MPHPEHELRIEDLRFDPPALPLDRLQPLALELYGIQGVFHRLEGERDQNYRITTPTGSRFVLKISGAREDPAVVDFQVKALQHIAHRDPEIPVPRVVSGKDGRPVQHTTSSAGEHAVRLLTWLPGIRYQEGSPPSLAGLRQAGAFLARLNLALTGFAHPSAGHFMPWDSTQGLLFWRQLRALLADEVQDLVGPVLEWLSSDIYPRLAILPRQVIHQDGHGGNLLRESAGSEEITGVIDFGDMIHGPLVCDLAVSLTHFIEGAEQPTRVAAAMCGGFHSVLPLGPESTDLLLGLVIARHILILELFEFRRRNMEFPPQFVVTDQPGIIASLRALLALDREAFNQAMREACA